MLNFSLEPRQMQPQFLIFFSHNSTYFTRLKQEKTGVFAAAVHIMFSHQFKIFFKPRPSQMSCYITIQFQPLNVEFLPSRSSPFDQVYFSYLKCKKNLWKYLIKTLARSFSLEGKEVTCHFMFLIQERVVNIL